LGRNSHGNFEKSVKKTFNVQGWGVYSEEVHLYGEVECTVHPQTVQSKEVFIQMRCSI
jgi:hypothetical protein